MLTENKFFQRELHTIFDYKFNDQSLFESILSRKEFLFERLEFLGDVLLNFFISENLITNSSGEAAGLLSSKKSILISKTSFACIFDKYFKDEQTDLNKKYKADILECIFGAIYMDSNYDVYACKNIFNTYIKEHLDNILHDVSNMDFKSLLQSFSQRVLKELPVYTIISHYKMKNNSHLFKVAAKLQSYTTFGMGSNLVEAEQDAAKELCDIFKINYTDV